LIFQTENGMRRMQHDLRSMFKDMMTHHRERIEAQLRLLVPQTESDRWISFAEDANVAKLAREVRRFRPDVVVFDPLADFFGGDSENDAQQMNACYRSMMKIARAGKQDAAVVIVHHARAGKAAIAGASGYDAANFGRGSKALYSSVRGYVNVAPGSPDDKSLLVVAPSKNNNGLLPPRLAVRLDAERMTYLPVDDFSWGEWDASLTSKGNTRSGRPAAITMMKFRTLLPALNGMERPLVRAQIMEEAGICKSTFNDFISNNIARGELFERGHKLFYPHEAPAQSPDQMGV
jgi:hypothetical protein